MTFNGDEFSGIVAEKSHRNNSEFPQDLYADPVISLIRFESKPLVGLHGVEPLVLKGIRANLVRQTDSAAFLVQVKQHTSSFPSDATQCPVKLAAAVTSHGMKDVSSKTLRMHPNEHILAVSDVSTYKSDVYLFVDLIFESMQIKVAVLGRQLRRCHLTDDRFGAHAIGNQICHSYQRDAVAACEETEFRHSRHCAILIHYFTDYSGRTQTGHTCQVHSCLSLPSSCQHSGSAGTQWKDVAGTTQI